jgi:LytS/YehU family sensor histidine kinase
MSSKLITVITFTIIINVVLYSLDVLARVPFWNIFPNKPALSILFTTEFVRDLAIAVVIFFIIRSYKMSQEQTADLIHLNNIKNENLMLQINALSAQLHPHFFFNNLNVLSELIRIDIDKSEEYIQQLSSFFRYLLSIQQHPLVTLDKEIEFIETYIYLLKIRYGKGLDITFELPQSSDYLVPSLSTLVAMENIVKHNDISMTEISFHILEDEQVLRIANTLCPKNTVRVESLGYGLDNLDRKCKLLLNKDLKTTKYNGYFTIDIPLQKQ